MTRDSLLLNRWPLLAIPLLLAIVWLSVDVSVAAPADNQWLSTSTSIVNATAMQDQGSDLEPLEAKVETSGRRGGINFLTLLTRGGWFMLPLLLLSILVVTIGVERFLALRREKIFPPELVDEISFLSSAKGGLDPRRVYYLLQDYPSSATYILRTMLMKVGRPQSEMENAVSESAQREATRLSSMTSWLTLAAAIAPLIGLLGTVWGITQAFYDTTQLVVGQNRAEALAQGIYTALVTTMTGLLIAIPAAILSHYYENRIIQLINEIEEMAYHLLPQLEKHEGEVRFTGGGFQHRETAMQNHADTTAAKDPINAAKPLDVPAPEKLFKPKSK